LNSIISSPNVTAEMAGEDDCETTVGTLDWTLALQLGLWIGCGMMILALLVIDLHQRRDAASALLLVWIVGVFTFSAFINWSINARSLLPLVPAVAILLVRRLDARSRQLSLNDWRTRSILAAMAVLSLTVAWADMSLARAAHTAAQRITDDLKPTGRQLWFQGHWGFQYAMEQLGGRALDTAHFSLAAGDLVVLPRNNSGVLQFPDEVTEPLMELEIPVFFAAATMCDPIGAGFFSDAWGPLPFAFGLVPPEQYRIVTITRSIQSRPTASSAGSH
jgi:hypothetical protein